MEREPDQGFRVRDRRRQNEPDTTAPPPSTDAPHAQDAHRHAPAGGDPHTTHPPHLAGLFIMLASLALAAMGEGPVPPGERPSRDLAQASEFVGLLMLLREKTEGNRTPEETRILEEIIYDLQLRYVQATQHSG